MIGAAAQEPSSVVCEVDAFPPPDTFEWTLNNSAGSTKVDPVSNRFIYLYKHKVIKPFVGCIQIGADLASQAPN